LVALVGLVLVVLLAGCGGNGVEGKVEDATGRKLECGFDC
jgi:hypothetical protein